MSQVIFFIRRTLYHMIAYFFMFICVCMWLLNTTRSFIWQVKKKEDYREKLRDSQSSDLERVTLLHNITTHRLLSLLFVSLRDREGYGFKTHSDLHSLTFCTNSAVIWAKFNVHLRLSRVKLFTYSGLKRHVDFTMPAILVSGNKSSCINWNSGRFKHRGTF